MENVIVSRELTTHRQAQMAGYLTHGLCTAGEAVIEVFGQEFRMQTGDCFIVRKSETVQVKEVSAEFEVLIVYVLAEFIELATPLSNYGMRGSLMLFNNPIIPLNEEQRRRCRSNMENIAQRVEERKHLFYRDMMLNAIQTMVIDFFDFHAAIYGEESMSQVTAALVGGFMQMLDGGAYREHRELAYYADKLNVTSKHLSETVKRHSGFAANYWINRHTALELSRLLRNSSLTLQEIADMFGFPSVGYMNRFVKTNLGIRAADLRR